MTLWLGDRNKGIKLQTINYLKVESTGVSFGMNMGDGEEKKNQV